jgi:hypothetical protein
MRFPEPRMNLLDLLCACFDSRLVLDRVEGLNWKSLDWENFIRIAGQELVLPALHGRLEELGVSSRLPDDASNFFAAVAEMNLERNQAILSDVAAVASLLNKVGIEPVLLKGAAYCLTGVYASLATRYLWDVDLLIPEAHLSLAVEAMVQDGFEPERSYRLGRFRHHHPPLARSGSISFELHHSLGMGICKSLLPASEVLEHSVGFDFLGAKVRVPSPDHLMTHLIMHSQIQHPYNERIWPPLRAMLDLVLVRRRFDKEIDWSAIQRRYHKVGQSGVLALHLLQVRDVLGAEPPFSIRLTGLTYLRWLRRKLLRKLPSLRFVDPVYMYSTVLVRRLRLLRNALAVPGGWRYIAGELFAHDFYKRFVRDIVEGHGR